jgi:hypothetical protein
MLESEIIHLDYQKIMAVILSIILQVITKNKDSHLWSFLFLIVSINLLSNNNFLQNLQTQLDVYSAPESEREREQGLEVLDNLRRLSILPNERPNDALDRMEQAAYVIKDHVTTTKLKKLNLAENMQISPTIIPIYF